MKKGRAKMKGGSKDNIGYRAESNIVNWIAGWKMESKYE